MDQLKLKFTYDQVCALRELLSGISQVNFNSINRELKPIASIGYELLKTFESKYKALLEKGLLGVTKITKITFPYYQLDALKTLCVNLIAAVSESEKRHIQTVIFNIDPLL